MPAGRARHLWRGGKRGIGMKLDIYNHIFPVKYFERMQEVIPNKGPIKRWLNIPVLYDVEARLRMMDGFGEYQQILSNSMPPIEFIADPTGRRSSRGSPTTAWRNSASATPTVPELHRIVADEQHGRDGQGDRPRHQ